MSNLNLSYTACLFFILYILAYFAGCKKEYSLEGQRQDSTILRDSTINDSVTTPVITLPGCKECNSTDSSSVYMWSFKAGTSLLCGNVTNAVLSPDHNAMTFFGPSTCSADSGLIITAYFHNEALSKDQRNFTADRAALEYYDNISMIDILQSKQPNIFSLTFDSYSWQSRVASGTFTGSVVDKHGNVINVDAGRFKIKFQ